MACECVKEFDAYLAPHNGKIATGFLYEKNVLKLTYFVATEKLDTKKRKDIPRVVMTYCPFCGVKYDEDTP